MCFEAEAFLPVFARYVCDIVRILAITSFTIAFNKESARLSNALINY